MTTINNGIATRYEYHAYANKKKLKRKKLNRKISAIEIIYFPLSAIMMAALIVFFVTQVAGAI